MHRLIVVFLAAFDALIAAVVAIAAVLATLTLLWVFGFGSAAPWDALWPASVRVWQLGNLVHLTIALPDDYLLDAGIGQGAASFVLSLAPLAFAGFTAVFAVRSGARASRADAWITGVVTGALVFATLAGLAVWTSGNPIAHVEAWQAVLVPTLVFAVPMLVGALTTEWSEAGTGLVARARDRIEAAPGGWGDVTALVARGSAVVLVGLIGVGAAAVALALALRGSEVVALYESGNVDVLGALVITLGQLAYLPTLVVWGMSFVAGPGFAVGTGTNVSPAGTQLGVVPGIPLLGVLPEHSSQWLLLLALAPVALGAFAGWIARSRLVARDVRAEATADPASGASREAEVPAQHEPVGPRLVIAAGIALVSAGGAALLAWAASGSIGPGRLAETGPTPGPVALAVGLEVLVGATILLLSPRRTARGTTPTADDSTPAAETGPALASVPAPDPGVVPDPGPAAEPDAVPAADPDAVTAPITLPSPADDREPPVD